MIIRPVYPGKAIPCGGVFLTLTPEITNHHRMDKELFELEFDQTEAVSVMKARTMATYLEMHPEELVSAFTALYDTVATLKLELYKAKTELARKAPQP